LVSRALTVRLNQTTVAGEMKRGRHGPRHQGLPDCALGHRRKLRLLRTLTPTPRAPIATGVPLTVVKS
jgi:hypothetical protein